MALDNSKMTFQAEEFKKRLQMTVKHNSMTRKSFAEMAGISYSTFQNYFSKGNLPGAEVLWKIHETFGVNIDWLLTGKGKAYWKDPRDNLDKTTEALTAGERDKLGRQMQAIEDLGLGDVLTIATLGSQMFSWRVIVAIQAGYPRAVNMGVIARELSALGYEMDKQRLNASLLWLERAELVVKNKEGEYRARESLGVFFSSQTPDINQQGLEGVRILVKEILPAVDGPSPRGTCGTAIIRTDADARETMVEIRKLIQERVKSLAAKPGKNTVSLVFGMAQRE